VKHTFIVVAAMAAVALAGCGKATEKATEKILESQMSKDGTQAKVDLGSGGMKVTTTDAAGKVSQVEIGTAKVSEAELGVPFYPGTQPREGEMNKVSAPDGTMVTVTLHSSDAPDKVANFYREKLKAASQGKQFTDMNSGDTQMFILNDDKTKQVTQITVAKVEGKGSDIHIMANHGTPK
jgi:hypothetical protein